MTYRNVKTKEEKREMEKLINEIKHDFEATIISGGKEAQKLEKLRGEVENLILQTTMFGMTQNKSKIGKKTLKKPQKLCENTNKKFKISKAVNLS